MAEEKPKKDRKGRIALEYINGSCTFQIAMRDCAPADYLCVVGWLEILKKNLITESEKKINFQIDSTEDKKT